MKTYNQKAVYFLFSLFGCLKWNVVEFDSCELSVAPIEMTSHNQQIQLHLGDQIRWVGGGTHIKNLMALLRNFLAVPNQEICAWYTILSIFRLDYGAYFWWWLISGYEPFLFVGNGIRYWIDGSQYHHISWHNSVILIVGITPLRMMLMSLTNQKGEVHINSLFVVVVVVVV